MGSLTWSVWASKTVKGCQLESLLLFAFFNLLFSLSFFFLNQSVSQLSNLSSVSKNEGQRKKNVISKMQYYRDPLELKLKGCTSIAS